MNPSGPAEVSTYGQPLDLTSQAAPAEQRRRHGRLAAIGATLVVALGLVLRLWILGRNPVTSDQAVVGLMAHEILRGHFFVFYWGQNYGGGEPYVVALLFALLGQSRLVLGLAPLLLDAIAAVLVWRIGRRMFGPRAGALAALIFWIWPEVYVYLSTVEYGFRYLTLDCGLALLLLALRLAESPASRLRDWAAFGLFLGMGWWSSPEIVYYAVPAFAVLVESALRRRWLPRAAGLGLSVLSAAVGALPWLVANVGSGFLSLRVGGPAFHMSWVERVRIFATHVMPVALGARLRGSGAWLVGRPLSLVAFCLLGVLLLIWLVALVVRGRGTPLAAFALVFPIVYTASSYSWYWRDGRYAIYCAPVLGLLAASALDAIGRRPARVARAAPAVGLAAALAVTIGSATLLAPYTPLSASYSSRATWSTWHADPDLWQQPVLRALKRANRNYAYASYWVAYALAFESGGRVISADPATDRYPPYLAAIERSRQPAWIFVRPSALSALNAAAGPHDWSPAALWRLDRFEALLRSRGLPFRTENAGLFTIVYPSRPVSPSLVAILAGRRQGRPTPRGVRIAVAPQGQWGCSR